MNGRVRRTDRTAVVYSALSINSDVTIETMSIRDALIIGQ